MKRNKYRDSSSSWAAGFSCGHIKVLIVCRGPIRKEAMDVFAELDIEHGILLSEKDSIVYPHALAPELRNITEQRLIHRVPDYIGIGAGEKKRLVEKIVQIARDEQYTHVFAGYGFMAEDAEFVENLEEAGIGFIGPSSRVHRRAGSKDEAKKLARSLSVSVTPGLDNISSLTLLSRVGSEPEKLREYALERGVQVKGDFSDPEELAQALLEEGYRRGIGLVSLEDLQAETRRRAEALLAENPGMRLRFKHIGGGGGKGQRIIRKAEEAEGAVLEALRESRALGEGDNKNFLIELNIENTRHNEIQLLGNGVWCVSLGGRDCSLQMHEQKLVELSLTDELYECEIFRAESEGRRLWAETLRTDRETLRLMEAQAEAFGEGVALDSASTFECIVRERDFYFMEMNTRIQVEHRVTEMVYRLHFINPDDPEDFFEVESLVEAMVLIAVHGPRLPRPIRMPRRMAGGEVRLNATDDALKPHAGGFIESWSPPLDCEIRDDQGIGEPNPDTGSFIRYQVAGAYDSNIALLASNGEDRGEVLDNLAEILRVTELQGDGLKTNLDFHYGMMGFIQGMHPMLKPDTGFTLSYLAGLGKLALCVRDFDLDLALKELEKAAEKEYGSPGRDVFRALYTLTRRPLRYLLNRPHALAGWLFRERGRSFVFEEEGQLVWKRFGPRVLRDLYFYMRLEERSDGSPSRMIWKDDSLLLKEGLAFYDELENGLGLDGETFYRESLRHNRENESRERERLDHGFGRETGAEFLREFNQDSASWDESLYRDIRAAHRGYEIILRILGLLPALGRKSGLFGFSMTENLIPVAPPEFSDPARREEYIQALEPPPVARENEIVAASGGMFYARETPDASPYAEVGTRFKKGDPLYIIEVMKMFNKVLAEFSGTVEELLVDGDLGVVVKKGQPLFRVKPDDDFAPEDPEKVEARRREFSLEIAREVASE